MILAWHTYHFRYEVLIFRPHKLHNRVLQIFQIRRILGRRPCNHIIIIIDVSTEGSKFFRVGKFHIHAKLLHNTLNVFATDANNALVVSFWNIKRHFGGQFFLQLTKTLKCGLWLTTMHLDKEVVVIKRLKTDSNTTAFHNFVDFAILLATNKLTVVGGQFQLKPHLARVVLDS